MIQFAEENFNITSGNPIVLTPATYSNGSRAQVARIFVVASDGGRPVYRFGADPDSSPNASRYFYGPVPGRFMDVRGFDNIASIHLGIFDGSFCKIYVAYFR